MQKSNNYRYLSTELTSIRLYSIVLAMIGTVNRTFVPIFSSFDEEQVELYADYIADQLLIASMVMSLFEERDDDYDSNL